MSSESIWRQGEFLPRVIEVLGEVPEQESHLGRPFVTAYQLAIRFDHLFPDVTKLLGYQVGGEGTGEYVSLAQYLARQLSGGIKNKTIKEIEGAWLSNQNMAELVFDNFGKELRASTISWDNPVSMFRLRSGGS